MNPSAADWIPKYFSLLTRNKFLLQDINEIEHYEQLRNTGFIYGVSIHPVLIANISELKLTREELSKVNLLHSFLYGYTKHHKNIEFHNFVNSITEYYKSLGKARASFLQKLHLSQSPSQILEKIISSRINESSQSLKKNNVSIFTYAFLYVDILGYEHWLKNKPSATLFLQNIEKALIAVCFEALRSKKKKNKYDKLLLELFAPINLENIEAEHTILDLDKASLIFLKETNNFEKTYIMDLCCLAIWNDGQLDNDELKFIQLLCEALEVNETLFYESSESLKQFNESQKGKVKIFEYTNPVKQVYKQSATTVKLVVLRNKSRLIKELKESGELLSLLGQSTRRDLNTVEKQKVKEQLLDICKSIPSLTIFLLPGGTILLPLLIKFLPKLLPSAFDENRIK